jgi:transketolase
LIFSDYSRATIHGWERYVGPAGHSIGMKTFGASAPLKELQKRFGFASESVVAAAREQVSLAVAIMRDCH